MTRKHYVQIAQAFQEAIERIYSEKTDWRRINLKEYEENQLGGFRYAVETVCNVMEKDNPRFNKEKFIETCFIHTLVESD